MSQKSFFKFNEDLLRVKQPVVNRTSAIFYFCHNDNMTTQIHFMNYWLIKRDFVDISCDITLRTMKGEMIYQNSTKIESKGAYIIEIRKLLEDANLTIPEGSIEIEFFSKNDLVISYPAALIRYVGNDWHTLAHSTQRIFSEDSGDSFDRINNIQEAEEGNITIHKDESLEPFFIIHNGEKHLSETNIEIKVTSVDGAEMISVIKNVVWDPYQTRIFQLKDILNYRKILKKNRGTFSVKYKVLGIFPRIIAGCRSSVNGSWSIDHTNFAASDGPVQNDVFDVSQEKEFKNLVFCIPNNFKDKWECFADIYPTYPNDDYDITINKHYSDNSVKSQILKLKKGTMSGFPRIDVSENVNHEIIFNHKEKLPRRFHMGIHYRIGSGNYGFLTDGPIPHSSFATKSKWLPIFDPHNCENFILIANRSLGNEKSENHHAQLKLFNSFDDEPIIKKIKILANQSICLNFKELFPDFDNFMHEKSGWIYMTFDERQRCVIHYASVKNNNSLATCHVF